MRDVTRKRRSWFRPAIAGTLLVIAFAGCGRGNDEDAGAQGDSPIRLGMPASLSGPLASLGKDGRAGVELAVEKLNAEGGLLGRQIELVVRDTQGEPKNADAITRQLAQDRVDALMAPTSSAEALAGTEVSKQFRIPMFAYASNTAALTLAAFQKYFFSLVPNSVMEAKAQALALSKLDGNRYGIIAPDYEGGHANADAFKSYLKEFKPDAEVVVETYPPLGETDFAPYLNKLRAAKPDQVFSVLFGADLITFTKQANSAKFFDATSFTGFYDAIALRELGDAAPDGARGYERAPFFALESPEARKVTEDYRAKTNTYPSNYVFIAYDAVMTWAQAVKAAKSLDGDAVVESIESGSFDLLRGDDIAIRALDHQAAVPEYFGVIAKDATPGVPFPTWKNVTPVAGEDILPDQQQVEESRQG
jgi:branched-chain amino acid transport system substrate-binding protein